MTLNADPTTADAAVGDAGGLPRLNTLWVEGALTYVEQVCLRSAVELEHPVTLYTYHGVDGVPAGVEVRDGREVLPEHSLVKHRARDSWGVGADLFRYELLRQGRGVWIDADVYLLRPLHIDGKPILFGWQRPRLINNAVLYAEADGVLLRGLADYLAQEHLVPWWLPLHKRWRYAIRPWLGLRPLELADNRWGITGPRAVTYVARQCGLGDYAEPPDVFYPFGPKWARDVFDPAADVRAHFTERTRAVHLWNGMLKDLKQQPPPPGCFMAELCERHGIATDPVR